MWIDREIYISFLLLYNDVHIHQKLLCNVSETLVGIKTSDKYNIMKYINTVIL